MEKQIAKGRLQRVEMVGWQLDVEHFFRKASIVCLTSQTEGNRFAVLTVGTLELWNFRTLELLELWNR